MLRTIAIAAVLTATNVAAGEIVWRSPIAGVLPYVSNSVPTEPEEPTGLGLTYPPLLAMVGKPFSVSPYGVTGGAYEFSASDLPAGMILSRDDGRLVGVISVSGVYVMEVLVRRDSDFEHVSVKITVL